MREISFVDPATQTASITSVNLSLSQFATCYETIRYSPAQDGKSTTSAMTQSCFRQVEYAGVLAGAKNEPGAKAFIDFMLGKSFQTALPTNMYVFPVDSSITLPDAWRTAVKVPEKTLSVDPAKITANRDAWLRSWQDATSG